MPDSHFECDGGRTLPGQAFGKVKQAKREVWK
jgi:hypothetical protein